MYKQKLYASINVGGLAIGLAAFLMIALYIHNELSYDLCYPLHERTYRVVEVYNKGGEVNKRVYFPAPLAGALKDDYPEIEQTARINSQALFGAGNNEIRRADQSENTHEEGFIFADKTLLNIFTLSFIHGSPERALDEANSIVITKRKADKYFPEGDPLGKIFILNNDKARSYKVTGVIEDLPVTSHLQFDFLISMTGQEFWPGEQTLWRNYNYQTYVLLRDGSDAAQLEQKLPTLMTKYFMPTMIESGETEAIEASKYISFKLQPVTDIYLDAEIRDNLSHGDVRYLWLFGTIAVFILTLACINFINLTTARSANRAKEVGLRKVVGSFRIHLVKQFLMESILFSFFSFVIAMVLVWLLLPYFNMLVGKPMSIPIAWWLLPVLILAIVAIGTLAGLYPSFYLSSFKPVNILKGNLSLGSRSAGIRSLLVVFQFTISVVLIISTLIIYRQMAFINNKRLGFDKNQVLLIRSTNILGEQINTFKNELLDLPGIQSATISGYLPVKGTERNRNAFWNEGGAEAESVNGQIWRVDHDYIKTMGMNLVQGRDFQQEMASDSQAMIINQSLARQLNLKEPLGKFIRNSGGSWQVIGVVEDFHFETLKENIGGLCLVLGSSPSTLSVKASADDMAGLVNKVTATWKKFSPNQPMRYTFLDESFARMYDDVQSVGRIFSSFAILAIIIACLGLFALSAFMAEQRSKEISIRMVLGASLNSIFRLLTFDFVKLVVIAALIASPLAWYMMDRWLEDFAYRTGIGWDIFLVSGLAALLIAVVTISYQSIRVSLQAPVKNLKRN